METKIQFELKGAPLHPNQKTLRKSRESTAAGTLKASKFKIYIFVSEISGKSRGRHHEK
jgi:hypothetical protein